jgi:hypothetical protein
VEGTEINDRMSGGVQFLCQRLFQSKSAVIGG